MNGTNSLLAINIATLWRHHKLEGIVRNILATTNVSLKVYFVVEDNDTDSINEVNRLIEKGYPVVCVKSDKRNCNKAINVGFNASTEPFFGFCGDDCVFKPNWAEELMKVFEDPKIQVTCSWDGLYDGGKSFYCMRRNYILNFGTIDEPGKVIHEGYGHTWVDNEFLETAIHRGVFHYCPQSEVKHCHYVLMNLEEDATVRHLKASDHGDDKLYESRKHLFS